MQHYTMLWNRWTIGGCICIVALFILTTRGKVVSSKSNILPTGRNTSILTIPKPPLHTDIYRGTRYLKEIQTHLRTITGWLSWPDSDSSRYPLSIGGSAVPPYCYHIPSLHKFLANQPELHYAALERILPDASIREVRECGLLSNRVMRYYMGVKGTLYFKYQDNKANKASKSNKETSILYPGEWCVIDPSSPYERWTTSTEAVGLLIDLTRMGQPGKNTLIMSDSLRYHLESIVPSRCFTPYG
jgi:hypothetical protein